MKKLFVFLAAVTLLGASCQKSVTNTIQNTNTSSGSLQNTSTSGTNRNTNTVTNQSSAVTLAWQRGGEEWTAIGTPPACPDPLLLQTPVDLSKVTAILYPGQTRGGNYKPHGGFRFNSGTSATEVRAPLDAFVVNGSRYIEAGEVQYLFTFIHPCGMMYRFDHLRDLSPAMAAIANSLPAAQVDNSATTSIEPPVMFNAGDLIATSVGFLQTQNFSVDFGVYDLRIKNTSAQNTTWAAAHSPELAHHGICWFDLFSAADALTMRNLPAGDQANGKTSDYCT